MEHNSAMRPLRALEAEGIDVTVVGCSADGVLDPSDVERALRPNTAMIAMTHASNVVGTIMPVAEVAAVARDRDVLILVDAAQSAGAFRVMMDDLKIDLLAFTGHKALYGPTGTGGLILGKHVDVGRMLPLVRGGTGSDSEFETQPEFSPDKYEGGTLNAVGLAGLEASVTWLLQTGMEELRRREQELTADLIQGLSEISGVRVQGTYEAGKQVAVVSFTIPGVDPAEIGFRLDSEFGIAARVGLQCSPLAHKTLGTFPTGTVRFSLGVHNTREEINVAVSAVRSIARRRSRGGRNDE
jgi:selenocysteine lyase/cysteine desulfurase